MDPTDLADVSGETYTYLMNGATPAGNWTGLFQPGERVRLRIINGSAMSYFDVRIPGLKMTVIAADGQPVHPVTVDEFRLAAAETLDVIVEPAGQDAFTIFAQANDRTGYAAGTLAVRHGLRAPVPSVDPRPILDMGDLGHSGAGHGGAAATLPSVRSDQPIRTRVMAQPASPAADPHAGHANPVDARSARRPRAGSSAADADRHPASERGNPLVDMQVTRSRLAARRSRHRPAEQRASCLHVRRSAQHVRRSRRPRPGPHDRTASDGPHGAIRLVVRRRGVLGRRGRCG